MIRIVWVFMLGAMTWLYGASLQHVVRLALKSDPEIKMLVQEYHMALQDVEIAQGHFRPTLDISGFAGKEYTHSLATNGDDVLLTEGDLSLTGKYNLFAGHRDTYRVKEKEAAAKLAEARLKEGMIRVSKKITFAYLDLLKKYKIYRKHQQSIATYRQILKKISQKIKDGGGRESDMMQIRSRMNYEESNLYAAEQQYEDAQIELEHYAGTSSARPAKLRTPKVHTRSLKLKKLLYRARKHNPTLAALALREKIAYYQAKELESSYYPMVDLEASGTVAKNRGGVHGLSRGGRVGVSFHYNLYNGGKDKAKIEKGRLKMLKTQHLSAKIRRRLVTNLKKTYRDFRTLQGRVRAIGTHIANAKKTKKLYMKEEEETGGRTIIDILNIEQEYNAAQISQITARYTAMQLYFNLLAYSSDILHHLRLSK